MSYPNNDLQCNNTELNHQYDEFGDLIMPDFSNLTLFPHKKNQPSSSSSSSNFPTPQLPVEAHAKFLMAHIVHALPLDYISLDPQRIVALHFAVIGLDLLGKLDLITSNPPLHNGIIEFIYSLQLPIYGFAGSPLVKSSPDTTPGHLAATYSAICLLKTLGDDLTRVNKQSLINLINECIVYIPTNSFEPSIIASNVANTHTMFEKDNITTIINNNKNNNNNNNNENNNNENNNEKTTNQQQPQHSCKCTPNHTQTQLGPFYASTIKDEFDVRFLFCALALANIFDLWSQLHLQPYQILQYITSCQTYEGGFSLTDLGQEAHGGATHTAIVSYWLLLQHLVEENDKTINIINKNNNNNNNNNNTNITTTNTNTNTNFTIDSWPTITNNNHNNTQLAPLPCFNIERFEKWIIQLQGDGWRGRTNKTRDCCYTYWLGSLLHLFDLVKLSEPYNNVYFVTLCENKERGGFGRDEDGVSEILHTFYAIAGMALLIGYNNDGTEKNNNNDKQCDELLHINASSSSSSSSIHTDVPDEMVQKMAQLEKMKKAWSKMNKIDPILGMSNNAVYFNNNNNINNNDDNSSNKTIPRAQFRQLVDKFNQQLIILNKRE